MPDLMIFQGSLSSAEHVLQKHMLAVIKRRHIVLTYKLHRVNLTFNAEDVVNLRLRLKQVLVLGCWNFDWVGLVVLIVSESNFSDICHLDI